MKKLMAIGLAAVMAFGLVGCGGSQSSAASSKSSSPITPGSAFTDTNDTYDSKETHSAEMEGSIDYEISRGITDYGEKKFDADLYEQYESSDFECPVLFRA